jgi:hypothetical protein
MSENNVNRFRNPHKKIGVVYNEKYPRSDQQKAPTQQEIGRVNNERDPLPEQEKVSIQKEIGIVNNERVDK